MSKLSQMFGGASPKIQQLSTLIPSQEKLLDQLSQWIGPEIGQAQGLMPDPRMAPPSPLQQMGFGMAPGVFGQQGQALGGILNADMSQVFDPIQKYAQRFWHEDVAPSIMEPFAGMDAASSGGMQKALMRGGERFGLGLASQLTQPLMQARGQQIAAAPMLGGALQNLMGMGGMQRGIGQEQLGGLRDVVDPFRNPALGMLGTVLPYGQPAMENIGYQQPAGLGYSALTGMSPGIGTALGGPLVKGAGTALSTLGGMFGLGGGGSGLTAAGATAAGGADAMLAVIPNLLAMLSDIRTKRNIQPITKALDKLSKLDGKIYNYIFNKPENKDAGIIAQDLEQVLPEGVIESNGVKFVKLDAIIALLVNAVKELNGKVEQKYAMVKF